jgi:hypothetical protein
MINKTIHSKNEPAPFSSDHCGTAVDVGSRVAFNRSGSVALGTVEKITASWAKSMFIDPHQWWRLTFMMKVRDDVGKIATLKNPNSFIVIKS